MKRSEAARVVAVLGAFFPSKDIREDTAEVWENAIVTYEVEDALEAAQVLGEGLRFMPSLAEFLEAVRDARNERIRAEAKSLPMPSQPFYPMAMAVHDHPELGERLKGLKRKTGVHEAPWGEPAANYIIETFAQLLEGELDTKAKATE